MKSHVNYRKTVYIGDDINDYLAAANAHFDYFIASTKSGKCNEEQFYTKIYSDNFAIETAMVDNLQMLNEWISSYCVISEVIERTTVAESTVGANSNSFFDSNSKGSIQTTEHSFFPNDVHQNHPFS